MPKQITNNVLSDDQIASELTALGCPTSADWLQKLCAAVAVHSHQGTTVREAEIGADGKMVVPLDGNRQPLHVDNDYDEAEVERKATLRSAIERKLNLCFGANVWVPYDGKPAAAAAAAATPQPAAAPAAAK